MITAYMALIPKGFWANLMHFTRCLLRTVWKGKDWKCSVGFRKVSPKLTCCAFWQQPLPEKADTKHSSKFDEKNKFCTFVKVFPPTLSLSNFSEKQWPYSSFNAFFIEFLLLLVQCQLIPELKKKNNKEFAFDPLLI